MFVLKVVKCYHCLCFFYCVVDIYVFSAAISALKDFRSLTSFPFSSSLLVQWPFTCAQCSTEYMQCECFAETLSQVSRWIVFPLPCPTRSTHLLSPSDGNLWKVLCLRCSKSFSKRTIEAHWVKEHVFSKDVVRGWHPRRGAMAVSEPTPR